jgi:SAM-dependent methyltransferase
MNKLNEDLIETLHNRKKLEANTNLLYWYKRLYQNVFSQFGNLEKKNVLEIGSGTSPLKIFQPSVKTSDIMALEYLDYQFDAHLIDRVSEIPDHSLDLITLTNVLHHLKNPLLFMEKAAVKLKAGGSLVMVEPYYSKVSRIIYDLFHHEPADFDITAPVLEQIEGPMSSANMAIPYLLFFKNLFWQNQIKKIYFWDKNSISYFTGFAYMATGGISKKIPIPHFLYRWMMQFDIVLTKVFPKLWASFFIVRLQIKAG